MLSTIIQKKLKPTTHRQTKRNLDQLQYLVIHHTGGGEGGLIPTLNSRGLSYHFAIRANGDILQLVNTAHTAFHARHLNDISIGIAFIGNMVHSEPTVEAYNACVSLIKENGWQHLQLVGHGERMATACPASVNVKLIADRTGCRVCTEDLGDVHACATQPEKHQLNTMINIQYRGKLHQIKGANVNGRIITNFSALAHVFGETEIGIRAALETAGRTVDWNAATQTIVVV